MLNGTSRTTDTTHSSPLITDDLNTAASHPIPLLGAPSSLTMSTILRTIRNLRRIGLRDAAHQMQHQGDTKAGTLVGKDRWGNSYYENLAEDLPLRVNFP